jgi:hypothetical protein
MRIWIWFCLVAAHIFRTNLLLATSPAFFVDETHVRCETPSFVPPNVTLEVFLQLMPFGVPVKGQNITYISKNNSSESPVSAPVSMAPVVITPPITQVPVSAPVVVVPPTPVTPPVHDIPTSPPVDSPSTISPVNQPQSEAPTNNSSEPNSPTQSPSGEPSTEINPWIIGSIAFALGVALATGATAIVCIKKAARRDNFEQL